MAPEVKTAVMAAPPVTVGPLVLFGVQLSEWVLLATLAWTLLLIIEKVTPYLIKLWRKFNG